MNTSPELIASLNRDLALEHGAIMQYVIHGVLLRDSALADPVKRVAREEMWHFEWLAEAIRDRGGTPTSERADVFVSAMLGEDLRTDVGTEQEALDHYAATLALIGDSDPDLTALIGRIVDDERHHQKMFDRLATRVESEGEDAFAGTPVIQPPDFNVIGPVMGSSYAGVLQYLFNKYGCGDCEAGEEYFELAVDEMKHAGWVANYVAGMGAPQATPVPDGIVWPSSNAEAAKAAKAFEAGAAALLAAKVTEAGNADLRADVERAITQHAYHAREIGELG